MGAQMHHFTAGSIGCGGVSDGTFGCVRAHSEHDGRWIDEGHPVLHVRESCHADVLPPCRHASNQKPGSPPGAIRRERLREGYDRSTSASISRSHSGFTSLETWRVVLGTGAEKCVLLKAAIVE